MMNWNGSTILVTGGASFIGSHLAEHLVAMGAYVRIADNLSSGRLSNLASVLDRIDFFEGDLKDPHFTARACQGCRVVFHLAADHGGRGYIATHPADCAMNIALDNTVFAAAHQEGVEQVVYTSSACVYPIDIQVNKVLLREDMVSFTERGGAFPDEEYGWAKLMGEMSLRAFHKQYGMKSAAVRIFTAFGPRMNETHAITALIAKAFSRQSPFEIWGDGRQTRNFTYIDDIVRALILAGQSIQDGSAVNAGTSEFISLKDAAEAVFSIIGWRPADGIAYLPDKPVGVLHRAADGSLARWKTGWEPKHSFDSGLRKTIKWYIENKNQDQVRDNLQSLLMMR